jgi:hypothetical protein
MTRDDKEMTKLKATVVATINIITAVGNAIAYYKMYKGTPLDDTTSSIPAKITTYAIILGANALSAYGSVKYMNGSGHENLPYLALHLFQGTARARAYAKQK